MVDTINLVCVSGGKDSTATLLLALERKVENLWVIFCDTGNEHPLTYKYVDYLQEKTGVTIDRIRADFEKRIEGKRKFIIENWKKHGVSDERIAEALENLKPTGNPFLDLCLWKGRFPSTCVRFCTVELKINTVQKNIHTPLLALGFDVNVWQGIRHDESLARAKAVEKDVMFVNEVSGGTVYNYLPILDWTTEDVFAYIEKKGFEANPLYKMGFTRVGCMPCINSRKQELREVSDRFPDQIDKVRAWETAVSKASKRGASSFFPVDGYKGYGIDSAVRWSHKDYRQKKVANTEEMKKEA